AWHVALSAERLAVARPVAWLPGKFTDGNVVEFAARGQTPVWQPAVAALARWLASKKGKKLALRLVLSGRFVRWQLLASQPEISRPDELAAYAALRFQENFGHAAQGWQVMHSLQPPGKNMPACAVDAALLEALRTTCESAGARLVSVSPYFAGAFDRWRHVLGKKTAWFGLIESDCVSLGLLRDGNWLGLRTQRVNEDWRDALPGMMVQTGISAGLPDPALPLYLVGDHEPPASATSLAFTWLQPKALTRDTLPGLRMAMGI
ncbi:MAG: hypothetical protein WBJ21_06275, partial [Burkholderiaceae bacterium]